MINSTTAMSHAVKRVKFGLLAAVLSMGAYSTAQATPVNGTGLVTPDIVFGSGNANGSFTGENQNNIEVGLRGKQRYPKANIFNYDGVDTYTFDSTVLTTNPTNRSVFNFEWSINVDSSGTSGLMLDDFDYLLSFDSDPSTGVNYSSIDPFNTVGYFDHSLGLNSTPNGGGTESTSNVDLLANMSLFNIAQQSSNLGFGFSADPDLPGMYNFKLDVLDKITQSTLSSAEIKVVVTPVPAPAPFALFGLGLAGLAWFRRKKA